MDRENIIKRFADYVYYFKAYCTSDADDHEMLKAVLSMRKEQEDTINELQNAYGYLQKQFFEAQDKLLKEQAKTKVVFGRTTDGEFVTECGNCGTYLDKAYSNCPKCKKELDWNSNQT